MEYKWIGAILIIAGCGGAGCSIAAGVRQEETYLRQLLEIIQLMENELQYRLTPLPEICALAAKESKGIVRQVFRLLTEELNRQILPDPGSCMSASIGNCGPMPISLRRVLLHLGHTLGRYDLEGQLRGLHSVQAKCAEELERHRAKRGIQLRSYQTLGLCAGAALAILFL